MKYEVLKLLKQQNGAYISGERLAELLHMTRTAVWKNIAALKSEGYDIQAVTHRGYALRSTTRGLAAPEVEGMLQTAVFGRPFYLFDQVSSTFDAIRQFPVQQGLTVAAKQQTNGRGRLGRGWDAKPGGIYFSFYLNPRIEPQEAPFITLQCALALQRAVGEVADCAIKWPNDLVVGGKKICGILTQTCIALDAIEYICAGIGINANLESFPSELPNATSLLLETGTAIDENRLLCKCLAELEDVFLHTSHTGALAEYKRRCITLGREVRVHYITGQPDVCGRCTDILMDGSLQVEEPDGTIHTVKSGEVSVRGIYGYI